MRLCSLLVGVQHYRRFNSVSTNYMSCNANSEWLEAAKENFEEALEQGDYLLCKDIVADVKWAGFLDTARYMKEVLDESPVKQFCASPSHKADLEQYNMCLRCGNSNLLKWKS